MALALPWRRPSDLATSPLSHDLRDLRAQTIRLFAGVAAAYGCLAPFFIGTAIPRSDTGPLYIGAILLATGGAAFIALRRSVALAAAALVIGQTCGLGLAQGLYPGSVATYSSCLAALAASYVLGAWGGFGVACVLTLWQVAVHTPPDAALIAGFLAWSAAAFAWLGTRTLPTAVAWALHSSELAHRRTEEARARQSELAQTSRNLSLALDQLTRANEELERARAAADEARRSKVELATMVSHELRTPLNLIIGFSEMMVLSPQTYGRASLPDSYRGDVEAIYRNACHLSNLIDDVLDLSQIDVNSMALQLEPCRISEVIEEAVASVLSLFAEKHLRLDVRPAADLPSVVADPVRVRQVLINLLVNAARYADHGRVVVAAQRAEGGVEMSVSDTGPGMSAGELRGIFSEFYRLGSAPRQHASGLGLAICKRLVELHGGRIWVESQPGTGTTFTFRLPSEPVRPAAGASWNTWVRVDVPARRPGLAVLAPDPVVERVLRRHLARFEVLPVEGVDDGVSLVRDRKARAILATKAADLSRLTVPDGGVPAGVPVLACLFTSDGSTRERGALVHLTKPVTRTRMRAAIARIGTCVRTVIVADDDPEMLRLLTRMLGSELPECAVLTAAGGRALVSMLETVQPDAILLDLLMPDLDGYEVLDHLERDPALRDIPVIVVSARGNASDRIVARELTVTRQGGMSLADALRGLQAALNALLEAPTRGSASARRSGASG